MKKEELKKMLKPLIKECIKEVLFEQEGTLSHIISEVASGLSSAPQKSIVKESPEQKWISRAKAASGNKNALLERKKQLLDAIGKDAYGGVNLFEGTTPAPAPASNGSAQGPLSGVAPNDPGVDIGNIFSGKSAAIFNKMMEKK